MYSFVVVGFVVDLYLSTGCIRDVLLFETKDRESTISVGNGDERQHRLGGYLCKNSRIILRIVYN